MLEAPRSLPTDPAELRVTAEGLMELAKAQALKIAKLEHQLAGHRRHRFGSKSETSDQLDLQFRLEEEEVAAGMAPKAEQDDPEPTERPRRKPLPANLPRNDTVLSPGETCVCGGKLRTIDEDVTEELGIHPRPVCREPDRPPPDGLPVLREDRSGAPAFAADRAWASRPGAARACAGQQIRRSTVRCTVSQASTSAKASTWIARPWPTGSAGPRHCWSRWPMQSAVMSMPDRRSSRTTRH